MSCLPSMELRQLEKFSVRIPMDEHRFKMIVDSLPKCGLMIGYGSGVIRQTGKNSMESPLIDLLVMTDGKNEYIDRIYQCGYISPRSRTFAHLCHPEITFFADMVIRENLRIKLGVIEKSHGLDRLEDWDASFYIAGRLQKPTKILFSDSNATLADFDHAQNSNLKHALNAAVLALPNERLDSFTTWDLFTSLVDLSYLGDIRMGIAEDPYKTQNIVDAQLPLFEKMYCPHFESAGLVKLPDGGYRSKKQPSELWASLPPRFVRGSILLADPRASLIATIARMNRMDSLYQAAVGVGTTGMSKSLQYLARKVSKRFR